MTVVLTGDGGDETFGGYERFGAASGAAHMPAAMGLSIRAVAGMLPPSASHHGLRRSLERFAAEPRASVRDPYLGWVFVFGMAALEGILSPDLITQLQTAGVLEPFQRECEAAGDVPLLHRLMFANLRTYPHEDLLVKTDRMAMARSLEARCPLLDTHLVDEVAGLPPWMKATPFGLKRVLRRAVRDLVPSEGLRRRKHGFGVSRSGDGSVESFDGRLRNWC